MQTNLTEKDITRILEQIAQTGQISRRDYAQLVAVMLRVEAKDRFSKEDATPMRLREVFDKLQLGQIKFFSWYFYVRLALSTLLALFAKNKWLEIS